MAGIEGPAFFWNDDNSDNDDRNLDDENQSSKRGDGSAFSALPNILVNNYDAMLIEEQKKKAIDGDGTENKSRRRLRPKKKSH